MVWNLRSEESSPELGVQPALSGVWRARASIKESVANEDSVHTIAFCCAFYPRATLQARTNVALADSSASWCEAVRARRCGANVLGTALCARQHVCPVPTEEEVVWRRRRGRNRECAPRCSAAASRRATRTQSVVPAAATCCAPSRTASFAHLP